MYKLVFIFSIFGLVVLSATFPQNDGTVTDTQNASDDGTKVNKQIFTIETSADGTPLQQCECRPFHNCDRNDVFDPNLNQSWIRCDNQVYVCCIIKGKETDTNNSPAIVDSSSPPNSDVPLGQPVDETVKQLPEENCTCVPLDKCSNETYVNNYGAGTIGVLIRITPTCETHEVCCPVGHILNEGTKTGVPTNTATDQDTAQPPPSPPPSSEQPVDPVTTPGYVDPSETTVATATEKEVQYAPTQAPQTQCSCVLIDQCKNEAIRNNHGAGILQLRAPSCDVNEVCCLVSDVVAAGGSAPGPTKSTDKETSTSKSSEQECGVRKKSTTRVTDGGTVDETYTGFGEFPWMMMVLKKESETEKPKMICGGSLVAPNMVLTAAHCVHKIEAEKLIVRAGEYDSNLDPDQEEQPHQERFVSDIRIHPFYRSDVIFNDMALLITNEVFKLEPHVSPICLPFLNSKYADPKIYDPSSCIATGWGKEVHGDAGSYQNTLKKVDLSLVAHHQCETRLRKTRLGPKFLLHSSFICAGGEIGKDTCQGDGGGPLFCALRDKPERYVQVGITSWGVSCGQELPGVYTNVYANSKWLTVEINMSTIFSRKA